MDETITPELWHGLRVPDLTCHGARVLHYAYKNGDSDVGNMAILCRHIESESGHKDDCPVHKEGLLDELWQKLAEVLPHEKDRK